MEFLVPGFGLAQHGVIVAILAMQGLNQEVDDLFRSMHLALYL